jgi:glyoxylase-like metal-dependent hydrolase (beta-lactamase superfamily II)
MRLIDLHNQSTARSIGTWIVDNEILVDPGPASTLPTLLSELEEGWRPRAIALTHIHLDHAGATGTLLRLWPDCEVWVHDRGASHLVDPTRLLDSAHRLYGDRLRSLFGPVLPVPEAAIRPLVDGLRIGPFEVIDTPGHARHHIAYFCPSDGTAFVGDIAGVRIPPSTFVLPPTMPPEFDAQAWLASIEKVKRLEASRLVLTHFGAYNDVGAHLSAASESVTRWSDLARALPQAAFVDSVNRDIAAVGVDSVESAYEIAAAPDLMWLGARRYWQREGASSITQTSG